MSPLIDALSWHLAGQARVLLAAAGHRSSRPLQPSLSSTAVHNKTFRRKTALLLLRSACVWSAFQRGCRRFGCGLCGASFWRLWRHSNRRSALAPKYGSSAKAVETLTHVTHNTALIHYSKTIIKSSSFATSFSRSQPARFRLHNFAKIRNFCNRKSSFKSWFLLKYSLFPYCIRFQN